jgi:hypothetical protein
VRVEAASWHSRDPLRPDRWGHGWHTASTACPRGSNSLRPVSHG